ncbi:MAG: hypothetical protein JJU10_04035 [Idiomarina sp.]|nr:hypothetical protein [Idiomarina sp.]
MTLNGRTLLIGAAISSALAALAHLGCIIFGGDWYRFMGAGEQMALLAEQGSSYPAQVTAVIVVILLVWSLYALSGAGVIRKLPLVRTALCLISAVLLLRGLGFYGLMTHFPDNSMTFWLVSSGICLFMGSLFALGTRAKWQELSS